MQFEQQISKNGEVKGYSYQRKTMVRYLMPDADSWRHHPTLFPDDDTAEAWAERMQELTDGELRVTYTVVKAPVTSG